MFAIPGILALIFFIYIRPQEVVTSLQAVPLLYVFFALALFGLAVDIKRGINRFTPSPQTMWVGAYLIWSLLTVAVLAPASLARAGMSLMVPMLLYLLVAQGVRSFRSLALIAGLLFGLALVLGFIGAHQGQADFGCAVIDQSTAGSGTAGTPDGRPCETEFECYLGDPEPGADYLCERIGLLDTTSVAGGRIRYRGLLQDPNELGLAITLGLMLGFAFYRARPTLPRFFLIGVAFVLVSVAVYFTRSRSGQLALMSGLAVWAVHRWRWRAILIGVIVAGPLLVVISSGSGREDSDTEESTEARMEAWSAGLDMFNASPLIGVGAGQFTQHHIRTAHNSFVLSIAETGLVGVTLWAMCIYVSFKIAVVALRRYARVPAAHPAVTWSIAILSTLIPMVIGTSFISWTTHEMFWIHIGLAGGLYSAIRAHDPTFEIRIRVIEVALVCAACLVIVVGLRLYLRLKGY